MADLLAKLKFPSLLLLGGLLLGVLSASSKIDFKNLAFDSRAEVVWPSLGLGLMLCLLGVLTFLAQEGLMPSPGLGQTRKVAHGFTGCIGSSRVNLLFGRLEDLVPTSSGAAKHMVMLPTDEFFDDDCVRASNTACGSYLGARAPRHLERLVTQIEVAKAKLKPQGEFEKRTGAVETSYGTGVCLCIEDPAGLSHSLLLAAVASKRADSGFQSNPASLFQCLEAMARLATDERVNAVYLPLLGGGKGGLTPEASLMMILLALSVLQRRLGGFDSSINIVIFQPSKDSVPAIVPRAARRVLSLAEAMYRRERLAH